MPFKIRKRAATPNFSSDPADPSYEHPTPKRVRVKQLRRDGHSPKFIKQETGVPRST